MNEEQVKQLYEVLGRIFKDDGDIRNQKAINLMMLLATNKPGTAKMSALKSFPFNQAEREALRFIEAL
jgi:hypothetical protein